MYQLLSLLVLLMVMTFPMAVQTQSPAPHYPLTIPVRDGKTLAADLYASDTSRALPVILVQTPYNKATYHTQVGLPSDDTWPLPYDGLHYNYVVLDWRGRYASADADVPGYDRGWDGYDAVEWISRQKWCNGRVGTWGGSALGLIQFQTARHHPPHLLCAVPMVQDYKTKYTDYFYGGDFRREHVTSLYKLGFDVETVLTHPLYDAFWRNLESRNDYPEDIAVPMLLISGWFDHYPDNILRAFSDLKTRSIAAVRERHRLIMGPWGHETLGRLQQGVLSFANTVAYHDSVALKFFDYYLRQVNNDWPAQPVVQYYQLGEDQWRSLEDWQSLPRQTVRFYLQAKGGLDAVKPTATGVFDSLSYNPRDPSPSIGGSRFNPFDPQLQDGPQDLRNGVENRQDVLIYTTAELQDPLVINGAMQVELYVSCNRRDTDYAVRLCDVYPDGRSLIMTQGIRRARLRDSFSQETLMQPNQIYTIVVELQNIALTIMPGHRLRIDLTGSDYPHFDLNLNNGGPMYTAGDTLVAHSKIYRDASHPSALVLQTPSSTRVDARPPMPKELSLLQCYPNPFNATMTITFHLAQTDHIRIHVVDLLGREKTTMIDDTFGPGHHTIHFDAIDLASGIYWLKLSGKHHQSMQKVTLLR